MKKDYMVVDEVKMTVTVSKDFLKKAGQFGTPEFIKALEMRKEGFTIVERKIKKNPDKQTYADLTYRRKIARLGTPYAAPIWICGTFSYRGKAYCASKQIPEKILLDLIAGVLDISPMLDDQEALDRIHHIEMHLNNRVLFVFQDGHTEEHFWKDHSRKDSWGADKRKKAAEKTREQRRRRKEQTAQ